MQKPKAVCPLPYLTSKVPPNRHHFKASDFGSFPARILSPTLSHRLLFSLKKPPLFYGVPCALCTNFFAGRERIDELDMFVEVPFLCLCCCCCTEAKRSPSPLSTSYLVFSTFVPFTCSVFTRFSTLNSFSVLLGGSAVCLYAWSFFFFFNSQCFIFFKTITREVLHGSS